MPGAKKKDLPSTTLFLDGVIKGEKSLLLGKELAALVNQAYKVVVIDFSEASFIDSSGLGALLYYRAVLEAEGIELVLQVSGGFVQKSFRDCRLEEVFKIIATKGTTLKH